MRAARGVAAGVRPVLLSYGLLGCGLLVILVVEFDPLSPLLPAVLMVVAALSAIAVGAVWLTRGRWRGWAPDLTVATAGAYAGLTWAAVLHATPYPPLGLAFDTGFRVQAVSRFADTWRLADLAYQGLPAFYPPALPYAVGRAAQVTGLPSYQAWKYAIVLVGCAVPVLAYLLWRRLLPADQAALVSLAVLVPQLSAGLAAKPDEWLTLFVIVPWWMTAIYDFRRPPLRPWPAWLHGLVGAVLFCTYYYFYFILALGLLLAPLLDRWHPPRPGVWRRRLVILGIAAVVSAVYWGPLVASIALTQEPAFTQSQFFLEKHAVLPLPMFNVSVLALVLLAGLCYAIWTAGRDRVSAGLVLLTAAGYLWYLLGLLAAALHHPVLVHHGKRFILLVLTVAGIRAVALLGRYVLRWWPRPEPRRVVAVLGIGLAVLGVQRYTFTIIGSSQVVAAHDQPLPSGRLPRYHTPAAEPREIASLATMRAVIRSDYAGPGRPVVVAAHANLLDITPFYAFTQENALYAHPAGEFRARLDLLSRLAAIQDPRQFTHLAGDNRFDGIDAMVLRTTPSGLRYRAHTVDFPAAGVPVTFYFDRQQFSGRFWEVTKLDGYLTAVRRPRPAPRGHGAGETSPGGDATQVSPRAQREAQEARQSPGRRPRPRRDAAGGPDAEGV